MSLLLTLNVFFIICAAVTIMASLYLIKQFGRPWDVPGLWLRGALVLTNIGLIMAVVLDALKINSQFFYMFGVSRHLTALACFVGGFIFVAYALKIITNVFNRGYSQSLAKLQFWLCFTGIIMYAANRYHRLIVDQPYELRRTWQDLDLGNYLYVIGRTSVFLSLVIFTLIIFGAIIKKQPVKTKPLNPKVTIAFE